MYSLELITAMTSWAMRVEHTKVQASAHNIANANISGAKYKKVDFESLISNVSSSIATADSAALNDTLRSQSIIEEVASKGVALDSEVKMMTDAEARFKVLAQIYQRKSDLKNMVYSTGS